MLEYLFEKYLNVDNYLEHQLYKSARNVAIDSAMTETIEHEQYETYLNGFCQGYIKSILKAIAIDIKLQLKGDSIDFVDLEKSYYISRQEVLFLLKEILNGKI